MADLPEATDGPESRAGLEPEPPASSWLPRGGSCPRSAGRVWGVAPRAPSPALLLGNRVPGFSHSLWAHSWAPDPQGPCRRRAQLRLPHHCPLPVAWASGICAWGRWGWRMDPLHPGRCSLLGGACWALGQGETGRNGRPFPDVGWEQHLPKGKAGPSRRTGLRRPPPSSLGSAQRQPGAGSRP